MFDNSFSPDSPRARMSIEELIALNKVNPQQVIDYGNFDVMKQWSFYQLMK